MNSTISVIGLGKLGSSMLACFAHKGFNVIGVDISPKFVEAINNKKSPIHEPQVNELIKINKDRITATTDYTSAIMSSFASFIIVPTPSSSNGLFDTSYVQKALEAIALILKNKKDYHLIVITSTVLPSDTYRLSRIIENISGKKIGIDFGLCYNPDFIALGKIVHDFLNPDFVLIGQSDEGAGELLEQIHKQVVDNNPKICRMNFHNAELAKIALNSYCTMKITFANVIAEICENMMTGDANVVLEAIGEDKRIGHNFLRPGLAFSGPCLPRDNKALSKVSENLGVFNTLCGKIDSINDYHKYSRIFNKIINVLKENKETEIAILGLSYKENTSVIEESVSIAIIKKLIKENINVTVFDPLAMSLSKIELADTVKYSDSIKNCIKNKKICFIATPWEDFKILDQKNIKNLMKENPIIIDSWGILNNSNEVIKIGKNLHGKNNQN